MGSKLRQRFFVRLEIEEVVFGAETEVNCTNGG